jgi:Tfp pilus assembly protein PilX
MNRYIISNERGAALLIVMALLLMLTVLGVQMVNTSNDDVTMAGNQTDASNSFYAAESGQAIAKSILWTNFVNWASVDPPKKSGETGSLATYTTYLDEIGLKDSTSMVVTKSMKMSESQQIETVVASRLDQAGSTQITVASVGLDRDGAKQGISAQYRVEGAPFKGFDFAILAKNINCIMCHAQVDNVQRVFNSDPEKMGTFDRVKVASLESMLLRTTSAESQIAGTLYTRGIVTDKAGVPISNLSPGGMGLGGYQIDPTTGKIIEGLTEVALTNTTGSPLPTNGNLYMNYPTVEGDMTDGILPDKFPPPFPDDNGNKVVDNAEFANVANKALGSVSGGIIYTVPNGSTYSSASLPGSGNTSSISKSFSGNLILVGTATKPIELSGDIAVDGDVVIQGPVKGSGQIYARGSVYVTGNMTYADGTKAGNRTFGIAQDGTANALSIAAGKNILVGDYLTPAGGNIMSTASIDPGNLSGTTKNSFTMSEISLFNRGEWTRTQPTLPSSTGAMVANSTYDPTYVPRYYTMNAGDPVYIYNKNTASKGTYWDPATKSWKGVEHVGNYDLGLLTKINSGDPALSGAKTLALSSTNNWISPQTLKSLWMADESSRKSGSEFKIDGQLYTNNSIFTLTRSSSKTGGKMTINGAVVAADVGMLAPKGLNLHYDPRLKSFLKIKDASLVSLSGVSWYAE